MNKVFIIAELSANHNGSLDVALESLHAIKESGADAVKIQTYTADTITLNCKNDDFIVKGGTLWDGKTLYDLYGEASTPWEWHKRIYEEANKLGLICFSSPFDKTAVDFLESLDNPIYKIASFEITDIPLIEYVASKRKPIIISTGIATLEDIELAIKTCLNVGNNDITLLKCTSSYPAKIEDANLATIVDMKTRFGLKVGLSDHSMGYDVAVTAVALGAQVIEKHFIIDRTIGGPDAEFSMNKDEFKAMVRAIRNTEVSIGNIYYPTDLSKIKGRNFCRSLYICQDVNKGDLLTVDNVKSVRPGYGLHPKYYKEILGKRLLCDLTIGSRLSLEFIE